MAEYFMTAMNSEKAADADFRQLTIDIISEGDKIPDPDFRDKIVKILRERIDETRFKHLSDMKYSQSIRARSLMKPVGQQEMSPPALSLSSPPAPM